MNNGERIPGYWKYESSGVLAPVVMKYLRGRELTARDVGVMRAYLRQWIKIGQFRGVEDLRARVDSLTTTKAIHKWLDDALDLGIDPL